MLKDTEKIITKELVNKIAHLARLPLGGKKLEVLKRELEATFLYINKILSLDLENVEETSQVAGLENVFREDIVESDRTFTQEEALVNAKDTYKGYFKVKAIFDEE